MFKYRPLEITQTESFWNLWNTLDAETDYMMYEPKERKQVTNVQELKNDIENKENQKTIAMQWFSGFVLGQIIIPTPYRLQVI